jgi:hypothetical protein
MNGFGRARVEEEGKKNFSGIRENFCQGACQRKVAATLECGEPPLDAFPKAIRDWTEYYRMEFGAPEIAAGMAMVTALSGAAGQLFQVTGSGFPKPTTLNLWTCLVAESGSGKSSLIEDILAGFFCISAEIDRDWAISAKGLHMAEEALLKVLEFGSREDRKEAQQKLHSLHTLRHLVPFIQDITAESLLEEVGRAADGFAFLVTPEARNVFDNIFGRYSKSGTMPGSIYNSLYSGDTLCVNRISRERVSVMGGRMAMLLAVQPGKAKEILTNREGIDSGLIARMFFLDAGPWKRSNEGPAQRPICSTFMDCMEEFMAKRREIFAQSVEDVLDGKNEETFSSQPIPCSPEAARDFIAFRREAEEIAGQIRRLAPELCSDCARWSEAATKVAGNLAVLLQCKTIDAELSARAIALTRWCKKNFLCQVIQKPIIRKNDRFDKLVYLLEKSAGGALSVSDLKHFYHFSAEEIDELIEEHTEELDIEERKPRTGRPSKIIRLKQ